MEILPGPVNKRLTDIAANNKLVNIAACLIMGPPVNPWDSDTIRVASIISIIKMAAAIPPITSSSAMDKALVKGNSRHNSHRQRSKH